MDTRGFLTPQTLPVLLKGLTDRFRPGAPVRQPRPAPTPLISVIVPAHNEEGYLYQTLDALKRQVYDCFEVIVVANGCTDATVEEARGRCNRLIVLSQKGLGVSRNLGARMARGELLIFLDADTLLEPMALRTVAEQFSRESATGTLKGCPDSNHLPYKLLYALKNFEHWSRFHAGSSGVILCWKRHFMKVGGFDERLEISENSHLMRRLMKFGRYKYISEVAATTSMRRYANRGFGRMVWLWVRLWFRSLFGELHNRSYETVR